MSVQDETSISSCFYLRLQTGRDRIVQPVRILGRPTLVVNLHKTNFGELFEVQHNQIRDVELAPIGHAGAGQEDVRDAIADVQVAVAGESVIERDPAEGESLGGARPLEVFI